MDYQQTIDYLYSQHPVFMFKGAGAYKPGLRTANMLSEAFGNPHCSFKSIHIAGTNGKGSTSHMIASILMEAGYKVGLYTSPHIFDFRERIRVNGEKITEEAVVDFVERYRGIDVDCEPSFFELTTIMAFDYFRSQHVDIAVVETGLGGRLDTTNILKPMLSVITNVSLDHMALLGNSIGEIAKEKAGIIKQGSPVVIGEYQEEIKECFDRTAKLVSTDIFHAGLMPYRVVKEADDRYRFSLDRDGDDMAVCDLTGDFQERNINTVLNAMDVLKIADKESIRRGMAHVRRNTSLFGRWTKLRYRDRDLIADTGHNIGAWQYLAAKLQDIASQRQLRLVLGFSNDKDIEPIFRRLPTNGIYYFVKPALDRGRNQQDLLDLAVKNGLDARAFDSVHHGFDTAVDESSPDDVIFIGGSNFVVAELPEIAEG